MLIQITIEKLEDNVLTLPSHRPHYIIGCDMANGNDSTVTVFVKHPDGVLEVINDINHADKSNDPQGSDS